MEAVNNVLMMKLFVLLLHCVSYMHADCVTTTYKELLGGYNIFPKNPVFKKTKGKDIFNCGKWCIDEEFCKMWRFGDGYCQIFHSMKDQVEVKISPTNTTMRTYYETGQGE